MPVIKGPEQQFSEHENRFLEILSDGVFHSGQDLADAMGLSRSAISKMAMRINDCGLPVFAVKRRGYALDYVPDRITPEKTLAFLSDIRVPWFRSYDVVDSTNLSALRHPELPDYALIAAEYQPAGRGRVGRQYFNLYANQVMFTLTVRFRELAALQGLSAAAGVAVVRALRGLGFRDIGIKWPNDVYLGGRKLCGILIESAPRYDGVLAVIGIGVNARKNFLERMAEQGLLDQEITALELSPDATPDNLSRNRILAALYRELCKAVLLFKTEGLASVREDYDAFDIFRGREVVLRNSSGELTGICQGISSGGALLLKTPEGIRQINAGDMSLRPLRKTDPETAMKSEADSVP
jgi:BirA family biotin operon repressor/biotin-[acetyl-CoA-carboxylase] ligase